MFRFRLPLLFALLPLWLLAQTDRIYLAPDDHTDYLRSGHVSDYETWIPLMIDHYLDLNDDTIGVPPPFRSKWNCDGAYWMAIYQRNRSADQFDRFVRQLQDGRMTIPLNMLVSTYGGNTTEGAIRGSYYAGRMQRRYGLDIPMAVAMEDQTMPLGLASLWAGMGARYSWKGVCGCATSVGGLGQRTHEVYRYTGLDGQSVLMKWYSLTDDQGLGGHAEAWSPNTAVDQCLDKLNSVAFPHNYPYTVAGAFGRGWDNTYTLDDSFSAVAEARSQGDTLCQVSNMKDFFADFEATYGGTLPSETVSYGNEWDVDCASIAEVTGRMRRHIEGLRSAEAVATLAGLHDPAVWTTLDSLRERAMIAIGLYWEHNFGLGGVADATERATWERGLEGTVADYLDQLEQSGASALAVSLPAEGELRFAVVNPLGHLRTDVADLPYTGPLPVQVVDRTTSSIVPSQIIQKDGQQFVRILATDVPSAGYKVFTVQAGAPPVLPQAAILYDHYFESDRYKITMSGEGVITGLLDKSTNIEYVTNSGGHYMNDLGAAEAPGGEKFLENAGPVSATVHTEGLLPVPHDVRITLYADLDRIDIDDRITSNFSGPLYWTFVVQDGLPVTRHEELGAILTARTTANGGNYATQNARYDHLSAGHFIDMTGSSRGLTVSVLGPAFFKLGNSTTSALDGTANRIDIVAGANFQGSGPGIPGQDGDTLFHYDFSLRPHGNSFDPVDAMRGALAHQDPLVAVECTGANNAPMPTTTFSLLSSSDPNVVLWALKPAEEGIANGIIARAWNLSANATTAAFTGDPGIAAGWTCTHIETNTGAAGVANGVLQVALAGRQMRSFRWIPGQGHVAIEPWVWLDGPYDGNTQLMHDDLRASGLLPWTEPYSGLGYGVNDGAGVPIDPGVLDVTGPSAVVDWVLVELRDANDATQVITTRPALLHRNGAVTGTDGQSPVFLSAEAGTYHVVLRHRNHLGVMTADALILGSSPTTVDLRTSGTTTYGSQARKDLGGGALGLWAGNNTNDGALKYAGVSNDRDPILQRIGGLVPTATAHGYFTEDTDLSGVVKYAGATNDRDPILLNIGGTVPTTVRQEQLP